MEKRFRQLLEADRHRVYQLAWLLLGHTGEAEDVTQDCLIKLWQHLERLRPGEETAWLMTCARNACLDVLRRRSRTHRVLRLVTPADSGHTPEAEARHAQRQRQLVCALRDLPEPGRSLVILRDVQGLDVATVARSLALSENQVKVYTFRARRALRRMLEESLDEQAA